MLFARARVCVWLAQISMWLETAFDVRLDAVGAAVSRTTCTLFLRSKGTRVVTHRARHSCS